MSLSPKNLGNFNVVFPEKENRLAFLALKAFPVVEVTVS